MANETTILGLKEVLDESETDDPDAVYRHDIPAGVEVFEINGPFFFGAVHKFRETMATSSKPRAIILRLRRVMALDATGLRALEELLFQCRIDGTELILSGVHSQPLAVMQRSGLLLQLPAANVHSTFVAALHRAGEVTQTPHKP